MNWNNLDLSDDSHERDAKLIDELTCETLLLEISCNIKDINEQTVRKQFQDDLQSRIDDANDVFEAKKNNIVKQAQKERARK